MTDLIEILLESGSLARTFVTDWLIGNAMHNHNNFKVVMNGKTGNAIQPERGIRQSDPISYIEYLGLLYLFHFYSTQTG